MTLPLQYRLVSSGDLPFFFCSVFANGPVGSFSHWAKEFGTSYALDFLLSTLVEVSGGCKFVILDATSMTLAQWKSHYILFCPHRIK